MVSENRVAKENDVQEFQKRLASAQVAVLAHYSGITVEKMTTLRAELRKKNIGFRVVKNTLALRAIEGTPLAALKDGFKGPVALAYTANDPVALAKALLDFAKEEEKLIIRAGVLGGKWMSGQDVQALAKLPSREVMLARLVGSLQSPYANFVYVLSGVLRKLLVALDAVRRKKEEQGS